MWENTTFPDPRSNVAGMLMVPVKTPRFSSIFSSMNTRSPSFMTHVPW